MVRGRAARLLPSFSHFFYPPPSLKIIASFLQVPTKDRFHIHIKFGGGGGGSGWNRACGGKTLFYSPSSPLFLCREMKPGNKGVSNSVSRRVGGRTGGGSPINLSGSGLLDGTAIDLRRLHSDTDISVHISRDRLTLLLL